MNEAKTKFEALVKENAEKERQLKSNKDKAETRLTGFIEQYDTMMEQKEKEINELVVKHKIENC